jgi:hypothetical protein
VLWRLTERSPGGDFAFHAKVNIFVFLFAACLFSEQLPHPSITSLLSRSICWAKGPGEEAKKLHRTTAKSGKDDQGIVSWNETFAVDLSGKNELRLVLKRFVIVPFSGSKRCLPHF